MEHRRDALDRLLPTIRAAADPITRELYLSVTAQRAGVNKDVLEHELTTAPAPRAADGPVPSSAGSRPVPPRVRGRRNPETQLLSAMLASPEWVAKAREEVAPSLLESTRLRELFEALIQSEAASDQMPERLSPEAAAAWSYLKEAVQQSDQGAAALYDRAAQILRARPQYRVMDALTDPGEKRQRRPNLRTEYPAADEWYVYQKAAFMEARKAKRSRGA